MLGRLNYPRRKLLFSIKHFINFALGPIHKVISEIKHKKSLHDTLSSIMEHEKLKNSSETLSSNLEHEKLKNSSATRALFEMFHIPTSLFAASGPQKQKLVFRNFQVFTNVLLKHVSQSSSCAYYIMQIQILVDSNKSKKFSLPQFGAHNMYMFSKHQVSAMKKHFSTFTAYYLLMPASLSTTISPPPTSSIPTIKHFPKVT